MTRLTALLAPPYLLLAFSPLCWAGNMGSNPVGVTNEINKLKFKLGKLGNFSVLSVAGGGSFGFIIRADEQLRPDNEFSGYWLSQTPPQRG